jgi:hypothetical protein
MINNFLLNIFKYQLKKSVMVFQFQKKKKFEIIQHNRYEGEMIKKEIQNF